MALGPPLFFANGPGLGLNSRPNDGAWVGLGLGFLLRAFSGPGPWPGLFGLLDKRVQILGLMIFVGYTHCRKLLRPCSK